MRKKILPSIFVVLLLAILFVSCSPAIYYLGDSYASSSQVEVFYDAKEVKKEYKVIGRMVMPITFDSQREKKQMISEAKKKGADGIIFNELTVDDNKTYNVSVKAELIKFQ
jgi:hypothetical protein